MANNKKNANYVTDKTTVAKVERNKIKRNRKVKKTTLNVIYVVVAVLAVILFVTGFVHVFKACSKTTPREFLDPSKGNFKVTDIVQLEFADYGKVTIELYGEEAPQTVANFKKRVEEGYFTDKYLTINSTSTKYVSFVTEKEKDDDGHEIDAEPGIKGEYYDNNFANKISHTYGVITMNRNGHGYNSSSTDFMIITDEKTYANEKTGFNGNNAAFGKVVSADMEKIEKMASDYQGKSDTDVEEKDENALSTGSNKIALTKADIELGYIERTFTPKYEGYYFFDTTEEELVSIIINDGESQALGTGTKAVERYFEADKEYKLKINIKADSKEGEVKISINDRVLTVGTNSLDKITKDDITNSKVFYYTYTAPITGEYIFTISNVKGVKVVGKDGAAVADKNDKDTDILTLDLEADVVYTFEVPAKEASISGTATSVVPKIEVKEQYFEIGVEEKIKFTEAEIKDEKVVYTFVAGVSGKYTFSSTDIKEVEFFELDGKKLNIQVTTDGKTKDTNSANLEAGKTYKLSMKTKGLTKDKEYKLTIVEPKLVAGDNSIKLVESDIKDEKAVYTFTPEYTGKHTFSLSVNSKKDTLVFTIKDENGKIVNEYVESGKNVVKPYAHLEKDKTYTVELGINYKETSGNKDVDKKLAKDVKYTLTVDDPALYTSSNQNIVSSSKTEQTDGNSITITKNDVQPMTYVFNVEASGMYEIKIGTDMKENIKLRIKSGDEVTEVTEYSHIRLNKGDICEFEVNFAFAEGSTEKATTITVYQTYPKIISSLVANKTAK